MSKAIAAVLRDAAMGPNMGVWLMDWFPYRNYQNGAFMFAYASIHNAYSFNLLDEPERRMFLLFCSYAAEDEQ